MVPPTPLIIAHRGHSVGAPEQTLAAFTAAVELGADMIELDVRRTSDEHLVLMHDELLDRTTSGRGPIGACTLEQVRALDAGSWFGPEFAAERVPTLDELFDMAAAAGIGLCIEAKGETHAEQVAVATAIAGRIVERGRLGRDVLASFDHAALAAAAAATPGLRIAPDRLPERGPSSGAELVEQAVRIGAGIVQHHHEDLDEQVVAAAQAAGIAVWAWPTTARAEVDRAIALGVDAVMGDDVAAMVAALAGTR